MGYGSLFKKMWKKSDHTSEITFRIIVVDAETDRYAIECRENKFLAKWIELRRFSDVSTAKYQLPMVVKGYKRRLKPGTVIRLYTPEDQVADKLKGK